MTTNMDDYIEGEISRVEEEYYSGSMPAHNKEVLRALLIKEDLHWAKEAVREDNNRYHDDI